MDKDKIALLQVFSCITEINQMQAKLIDDLFNRLSQHVAAAELEEIAEAVKEITDNMEGLN